MAINKTFNTEYGIDVTHHVMQDIQVNRDSSNLAFQIISYTDADHYNENNSQLVSQQYDFDFSVLPASILSKINELKEEIESEMIANLSEWKGGTQIQDNGSPLK